ncbi:peptide chain release factor N(5)-glutamine methyltransferase [Corynebacterium uberis]|uniref:peptide chain release factor N(5)-glutamine methyltransferase n=1 Tax=Corynebacterium TaxID=1716 RepID=UPI001D0AFEF4|nr:peptide chain release factor N(5)-glutamine methyltransferase [Corynebacterium uberis]MCZ9309045.1 peptide chain release factor N(5)-glutamine methyltransferase [Corynebacterium sp. c6VSa_13]UDL74490.1 peptide chain release factor N(5)-glutamine methyltransferase [Corynebacterium uberis]UDL76675.1 peptide chain release factor N(5)-glutamine methyltransferase [Corynebacterium uberis]UDL78888.1 peptide chain release factor N(5)-glutamine methyltransferase [Corynebacterium uberis]UDL81166.1 pe
MTPEWLREAAATLAAAGVASPLVDARLIAAHLLGCGALEVGLRAGERPPAGFAEAIQRRASREPLQYILGVAPFGPLDLAVGPGVFIPRPETEVLADWAVRALGGVDKPLVVDLCTGSGALAAYIAHAVPDAHVIAVERSPHACAYARRNLAPYEGRVTLLEADATDPSVLEHWHGQAHVVVTNPPYVPETPDLDPEVYCDPHDAVFAGADGLTVIPALREPIARVLRPGGAVGIEHDDSTATQVRDLLAAHGDFCQLAHVKDLSGRSRFVTAVRV